MRVQTGTFAGTGVSNAVSFTSGLELSPPDTQGVVGIGPGASPGAFTGVTVNCDGQFKGGTLWYPLLMRDRKSGAKNNGSVAITDNANSSFLIDTRGLGNIRFYTSASSTFTSPVIYELACGTTNDFGGPLQQLDLITTGNSTFSAGITLNGSSGANTLTLQTGQATAFNISDGTNTTYMVVNTSTDSVAFNAFSSGATAVGGTISGTAGPGGATSGAGGAVTWTGGNGTNNAAGGATTLTAGNGNGSGNGGAVNLNGGTAGATGAGGAIVLTAGAGGATSGTGGGITITAGNGTAGNAAGGAISTTAGNGQGTGNGGAITYTGGNSGAGATGNGGAVSFTGGAAASTNGTGGQASLVGGLGTGSNAGGAALVTGGQGGSTGTGGAATITAGAGGATSGTGGVAGITGGAGTAGNAGGGIGKVVGGAGQGTGTGGAAQVTGGASGSGATGNGGAATITGGAALSTNGTGGAASLIGGVATGTGTGGTVTITGGASGGASGTAGPVNIDAGAATGGTSGVVNIGPTNASAVYVARGSLKSVIFGQTISGLGTVQSSTPTSAQLLGGVVTQTGQTGAGTVTLPTGTNLSAALALAQATGDSFDTMFANLGGGQTLTITGATGTTVVGNGAVPSAKNCLMTFVNTGANAWNIYTIVSA